MNLNDLVGHEVNALIIGQFQESLTPELYINGILVGIDQGVYIIKTKENTPERYTLIPVGQCLMTLSK